MYDYDPYGSVSDPLEEQKKNAVIRALATAASSQLPALPPAGIPVSAAGAPADPSASPAYQGSNSDYDPEDEQQAGLRSALMQALSGQSIGPSAIASSGAMIPSVGGAPSYALPGANLPAEAAPHGFLQEYRDRARAVRDAYEPGPFQQRYMDALANEPGQVHGFKAHLLGALKGLAATGSLGGAIYGAIDPTAANRAMYYNQIRRFAPAAEFESKMQDQRLRRAQEISGMTGIDPISGLETPQAEYKKYLARLGRGRLAQGDRRLDIQERNADSLEKSRQALRDWRKAQMDNVQIKEKISLFNRNPETFSPQDRQALATALNMKELLVPFDKSRYRPIIDDNGEYRLLDIQTGTTKAVTNEAGKPQGSIQGTRAKQSAAQQAWSRKYRVAQSEANAAQKEYDDAQQNAKTAQKDYDSFAKTATDIWSGGVLPEKQAELDKRKQALDAAKAAMQKAEARRQKAQGGVQGLAQGAGKSRVPIMRLSKFQKLVEAAAASGKTEEEVRAELDARGVVVVPDDQLDSKKP